MHFDPYGRITRRRALTATLAAILLPLVTAGCVVQRTAVYDGREFPLEQVLQLVPGLDRDEVGRRLGPPYAIGVDADGREFWDYHHRGLRSTTAGGGLLLVGFVAGQTQVGGEARVVFDAAARVHQVRWEIAGAEAYRLLVLGGKP